MPILKPPIVADDTIILGAGELGYSLSKSRMVQGDGVTAGGAAIAKASDFTPGSLVIGHQDVTTSTVILAVGDGGKSFVTNSAPGDVTFTLPPSAGLSIGWRVRIEQDSGHAANVVCSGTNRILAATSTRTYAGLRAGLVNGDYVELRYIGFGYFELMDASPGAWAALGAPGQIFPPQGANSYLEANTYSPKSCVIVANDLVFIDPVGGTSWRQPHFEATVSYGTAGPALNARDDSTSAAAYEGGYIYAIRNPSTGAIGGVRSASATEPTLSGALAGFTQWCGPLFHYLTDNTGNPFSIEGYGKAFYYTNYQSNELINLVQGTGGTVSFTAPSWAVTNVSATVPSKARILHVVAGFTGNSAGAVGHAMIAPGNSWKGPKAPGAPTLPYCMNAPADGLPYLAPYTIALRDEMGRQFAWCADRADFVIQLEGWEF